MRTFTKLRELMRSHKELAQKLSELEKKYDKQFQIVFQTIKQILEVEDKSKKKIGFLVKERQSAYKTTRKR